MTEDEALALIEWHAGQISGWMKVTAQRDLNAWKWHGERILELLKEAEADA